MGKTTIELPKDLKRKLNTLGSESQKFVLTQVIQAAERGHYHDFMSDEATPKINLIQVLSDLGINNIVTKVKNGDYDDESPDDSLQGRN